MCIDGHFLENRNFNCQLTKLLDIQLSLSRFFVILFVKIKILVRRKNENKLYRIFYRYMH